MFGNKEYSICQLSDQCEIITKGTTPTTIGYNFTTDGVRFIKIEDITEEGKFDTAKMMHISDECNMIMKRSQLKSGDLLFSIAGAIGRCAVVTMIFCLQISIKHWQLYGSERMRSLVEIFICCVKVQLC